MARFPGTCGEFIHGFSHDGVELKAAVFNENEVRAVAWLGMVPAAVALAYAHFAEAYEPLRLVATTLSIDFLLRVTLGMRRSPMGMLARWITSRQPPQWVSARPRRFAWTLGMLMAISMTVMIHVGIGATLPLALWLVFLSLMWLDAAVGLCLGCEMYGLLVRRGWIAKDEAFEVCCRDASAAPRLRRELG